MLDQPAAIVRSGNAILTHNAAWDRMAAEAASEQPLELVRSLGDGRDAQALTGTLATGVPEHGSAELSLGGTMCTARWATVEPAAHAALVVIEGVDGPSAHQASVIAQQRARIERLLIHRTIIEEQERRRLGRALHDVVAQDLARVRAALTEGDRGGPSISGLSGRSGRAGEGGMAHGGVGGGALSGATAAGASSPLVGLIDRIIEQVRTLAFELSPPVLEDLGLLAAVRWLAGHLGDRYGTPIEVADDRREPPLDAAPRTVAFRVLRELVVNAAKHAPGSNILISCETGSRCVRLIVRDDGPGFDPGAIEPQEGESSHFGLMSVREQVHGLGGAFELVSAPGQGTRATVTLPLVDDLAATNPNEGVDHG
ncbi:MAG: sensor histidine kinase [Phycisphaerales bacterium]